MLLSTTIASALLLASPKGTVVLDASLHNTVKQEVKRLLKNVPVVYREVSEDTSVQHKDIWIFTVPKLPAFYRQDALGAATPGTGQVWLSLDNISKYLGENKRSRRFQIALGRVIAHEVVHQAYPECGHYEESSTLMAEHASREKLLTHSVEPIELCF